MGTGTDRVNCAEHAYLWEVALAVADKQASLAAATVSYYNNLLRVCRGISDVRGSRLATRRRAHGCADGAVAGSRALCLSGLVVVCLCVV